MIYINVVGQSMYVSSTVGGIASGSTNFVKFKFNLSGDWDGLSLTARFKQGGTIYTSSLDGNYYATLPSGIGVGSFDMTLVGTSGDTVKGTTNFITFRVGDDGCHEAGQGGGGGGPTIEELQAEIAALEAQVNEKESEITSLETTITQREQTIAQKEQTISGLESEIQYLNDSIEEEAVRRSAVIANERDLYKSSLSAMVERKAGDGVVIPSGTESIGAYSFAYTTATGSNRLKYIYIPSTVTNIMSEAFRYRTGASYTKILISNVYYEGSTDLIERMGSNYKPTVSNTYMNVAIVDSVPDATTEGTVGKVVLCKEDGEAYRCTAASGGSYTWVMLQ